MKALLYITNYDGNIKINHVNEILREVNTFDLNVDVIIYTTEELNIDTFNNLNVNVIIKPKIFSNSKYATNWQPEPEFIWLHRVDIVEKVDEYDIFIHLEDDIRLTKENINQFIKYSFGDNKLDGYIIGNILYEKDGDNYLLPQFHAHFKGIGEIIELNGELFMKPKNLHQASYIISQEQLKLLMLNDVMNSIPKLVGGYNIKCCAVSELYCSSFLTKLIPIGDIDKCLTEHLSLKYVSQNKIVGGHWYNAFQTLDEIKKELLNENLKTKHKKNNKKKD